jgi:uncharacterized protein (TIGR02145 family)
LLVACGDDDSFSPVAKNRGYDYAFVSPSDIAKTPCNEMREGREAVVGRDKDHYECKFDYKDSVYIWVGYDDTLTAEGREFHRAESSSSEDDDDSSSSMSSSNRNSSSSYSSSYSSSSYSSSSYSSSSSRSSSSSYSSSSSSLYSTKSYGGYSKDAYSFALESRDDLLNPNVTYGTLIDERDGQIYKTVVVGNRVWMAQNLNFAGNDDFPYVEDESVCFNYDEANCALLGRLYSRVAAMNSPTCAIHKVCNAGNAPIRGVCPEGWHIPTYADATALQNVFSSGISEAKSAKTWEKSKYGAGSNSSGFSMPASGCLDIGDSDFESGGHIGYVWYYSQTSNMRYLIFNGKKDILDMHSGYDYDILMSVRCVSDDTLKVASSSSGVRSSSSVSSSSVSSSSVSSSSVSSSSVKSSSSLSSSSSAKSSSSSAPPSSSSVEPSSSFSKSDLFNPDITYGEMTDARDGKTYKTIVFNGQTWMAENLNYADSSKNPLLEGNSHCYDDDPNECEIFGRLYAHPAAMNDARCDYTFSCNIGSGHIQGICPDGWHIPTKKEAEELVSRIAQNEGKAAKSSYGWEPSYRGTNTNGLSFTGAGILSGENFSGKGVYTSLWAYNASTTGSPYYLMIQGSGLVTVTDIGGTKPFYSVRCIKD